VERRNKEIKTHLQALVYEKRIKEKWSNYLALVQRIMNYTVDGSIGTMPAKVIFGDMTPSDVALDLPLEMKSGNEGDWLRKARDAHAALIKATQKYLVDNQRKRSSDGQVKATEVTQFVEGQYVLLDYPKQPPNKLSGLYRGPMVITAIERPDIMKVRDLLSNKIMSVHTSRVKPFRHPKEFNLDDAIALAMVDLDEFHVESIVDHEGTGKDPKRWKYRVRWTGYEPEEDTWLPWSSVKELSVMDEYRDTHPELKIPEG
jgi:hypothetical protein